MHKVILLSAYLFLAIGCNHSAKSQEIPVQSTQETAEANLADANNAIMRSRQTAITQTVAHASPAVVSISVIGVEQYYDPFSDPWMEFFFGRQRSRIQERQVSSVGSGFIISPDGYIVTNEHVAHDSRKITVALNDGTELEAALVGSDEVTDLALIKVEPTTPLPFLEFTQAGNPMPGEWVIALGNPFGLFEASEPTVTVGVVSGVGRDFQPQRNRIYRDMIQTDASINQGNSGGPLLNALGEVIGVNTFIYTSGNGGSIGLGFAVPAFKAQQVIEEIKETGSVDRSYYVGLYGWDVDRRIADYLQLEDARGLLVRDVDPGSPAEEAGIQPYDLILGFENEPIATQSEFAAILYDYRPGDQVTLDIYREGRMTQVQMRIGSRNLSN